ncbi:MAG: peptidoglycan DD-metalloendopeptidase family protein [Pseudomonadota bacterium]
MSGARADQRVSSWCAALLVVLATWPGWAVADDNEARLKALRQRIEAVNEQIARDVTRLDSGVAELRKLDLEVQAADRQLSELGHAIHATREELNALRAREAELEAALAADRSELASQVRSAFLSGGRERIQLMLNQEDPAFVGRMGTYYRLFSERRAQAIRAVAKRLEALKQVAEQVVKTEATLQQKIASENRGRETLAATRAERAQLIARIRQRIETGNGERATLEREQARLEGLIADLQAILKNFPVASKNAFPKLKGELAWPITGQLLADFGQPRGSADVRWNGVLVGAERGTAVRAIARGRVAYADWLPGLGLLTVLEHSDNYISLYGFNESLAREAGEWVDAGDILAAVGDSGGQTRTALYFEIRRASKPLNPHDWFASTVSGR